MATAASQRSGASSRRRARTERHRPAGLLRNGQGLDRLTKLADRGEAGARQVFARAGQRFARAGQRLAHGIAPVIAALDPEVLLVAGEGTASWHHWDTAFRVSLARRLPSWMRTTPVEVDQWDESSWARGAAAIVLATPFDPNAFAGDQPLQVLARLHGDGIAAADR